MFSKKIARAGAVLGFALSAIAPALPAVAAVPADVFKDSQGNVYIHGSTATNLGQSTRIQTDEPLTRRIRAGYCGEIRISPSSTVPNIGSNWQINSSSYSMDDLNVYLNTAETPRCSGNTLTPAPQSGFSGFREPNAQNRVTLTGFTPGVSYDVVFQGINSTRSYNRNNCNFFRISNTPSNPMPATLTINGTNHTVSSLPTAAPPLCQRNSQTGDYVRYVPSTW
ncbi:MAG: hypothetical protein HC879_09865 [Leptolyngbyaceae cyanobacterium SL_5_9]|nr:hypothetical protein [Leptolyngbyaceae cyanobacterium SL_5_9]NJO74833.1 hypothetical protein [Leptolyngbyaceae cyanobacterium RM1_406_9]